MNDVNTQGESEAALPKNGAAIRPIFILGDSRTGTTTVHRFLKSLGYKSIHYFYEKSGVTDPEYDDFEGNWSRLRNFVDTGGFQAFSDYPLRTFYKQLFEHYPSACFILTSRKDTLTWRKSMITFFSKFDINLQLDDLTVTHEKMNEEIREMAADRSASFCDICIDDDSTQNGTLLANFLGHVGEFELGRENSSSNFDENIWSRRVALYESNAINPLNYLKNLIFPSKAVLSERGWVYLINDTSDFMDYFYGVLFWSESTVARAVSVLTDRHDTLKGKGISYLKYAIPEKASIYGEYLPRILHKLPVSMNRPALQLLNSEMPFFDFPLDWLADAKSYGQLCFRGDSHMNWLGAFHVYVKIAEDLERLVYKGVVKGNFEKIIPMRSLTPSIAGYQGDLFVQLDSESLAVFNGAWNPISHENVIEFLLKYSLDPSMRKSTRCEVESDYLEAIEDRETLRYTNPDKSLPRAVIFRDSTADYLTDLLAEHFSECIFIWHKGLVYSDVIEREKPDIVLHIMAERFLVQYDKAPAFHTLWPKIEAQEAES